MTPALKATAEVYGPAEERECPICGATYEPEPNRTGQYACEQYTCWSYPEPEGGSDD
jgi:hypothetical protein